MKTNGERNPEEILAEIERTRSDMDHTLNTIERRLTPGQLFDQGLDYLRHSGGQQFASNLGRTVRDNPVPVVLMGIGIAWLMASNSRGAAATGDGSLSSHRLSERAGEVRQWTSNTGAAAKERLSGAAQSLADTAQSARERLSQTVRSTREQWNRTAEGARHQIDRARGSYDRVVREQPLALAAVGVAVGALAAALAPRTQAEDEIMGGAAESVKAQLREAGERGMERAKDAVTAATNEISRGNSHVRDQDPDGPAATSAGASPTAALNRAP